MTFLQKIHQVSTITYEKVYFSPRMFFLAPILIKIIIRNNILIENECFALRQIMYNNIHNNIRKSFSENVVSPEKQKLYPIYKWSSKKVLLQEEEEEVSYWSRPLLSRFIEKQVSLFEQQVVLLRFNFYDIVNNLLVVSKCLDLVVFETYYMWIVIKNVYVETLFVLNPKRIFNKKWLYNDKLEKWIITPLRSFKVPGYSIVSKYCRMIDGRIVKNSTIKYHTYDIEKQIAFIESKLETNVSLVPLSQAPIYDEYYKCLVLSYYSMTSQIFMNKWVIFEKINKIFDLIDLNLKEINSKIRSRFSISVPDFKQDLINNNYVLNIFRFPDSFFYNLTGIYKMYETLIYIKDILQNININKGYIVSTNIYDENYYPVISDIIKDLITEDEYNKLNSHFKISIYKWLINIIVLQMYTLLCRIQSALLLVNTRNISLNDEMDLRELKSRLKVFSVWAHSALDNSIKQHLVRRNIILYSDTICGFDTEFVSEDYGISTLLSAQLSSSHVCKLVVPTYKAFAFEGVNTLTSETYMKSSPKFSDVSLVESIFTNQINHCRIYKFKDHDMICNNITNFLSESKLVPNLALTSHNSIFSFKKSVIKNLLVLNSENEKLKIKFATLINLITARTSRSTYEDIVLRLIESINFDSNPVSKDLIPRMEPSWDGETLENSPIEILNLSNDMNNEVSKDAKVKNDRNVVFKFSGSQGFAQEELEKLSPLGEIENFPEEISPEEKLEISSVEKSPEEMSSALEESSPLIKGELGGCAPRDEVSRDEVSIENFNVVIKRRLYLAAHYNAADLPLIEDWNDVSQRNVDIVKKSFSSLSIPLIYKGKEKVYLRDTLLLASATAKSLNALAYAYKMNKTELADEWKVSMDSLMKKNFELFKEYAMNDSLITLIHILFINDFSFKLGSISVPNTLGTLSSKYIKNKWREDEYKGYQINVNYPLGDVRQSHTPKGIQFGSTTLELSNLYIGSYRGGRNECFRYGIDRSTKWYDYDLVSCYSTIMGMMGQPSYEQTEAERVAALAENIMPLMGQPDYEKGMLIHPKTDLGKLDLLNSYSAMKIKFCLPKEIKYPPFPVTLDESITIYPSSGITLVTNLEYVVGLKILNETLDKFNLSNKEYYIEILHGSYIPFKTISTTTPTGEKTKALAYSPFFDVINELQENRRIWKKKTGKGSAMERIYKDLGNMLYGKIVCGISNKKVYDARNEQMKTMIGNDLANPIIGTWITGYVRALIAELLHKVDLLGGQVVSCTTDGFVTDVQNLESKICESFDIKGTLYEQYRNIRTKLSGEALALEVKTSVNGIIQWSTRGQLSISKDKTPISAITGYQKSREHQENVNLVQEAMVNGNKVLFLQKHLRGALDVYKSKKTIYMETSQRTFKTIFDSRREVIASSETLLHTKPFNDISEALLHRFFIRSVKSVYSNEFSIQSVKPSTSSIDEVVKYFIRMVLHTMNYQITNDLKISLATTINNLQKSISIDNVLDIFSLYELEKGNVVNKLPIFTKSQAFVIDLFNEIKSFNHPMYKDIVDSFYVYFDNFNIPNSPELEKLKIIEYIKTIDPRKLYISEDKKTIIVKE